ncbi:HAMP domain-containing histidine kinase [Psychromonas sp. RZ22]|uniref:sensor histidine kinase n=1 Tax=Psychromonas algarum TaxID=2555643 RepID=UPI0010675723|nr:HAMP domain-containing sensor histidine kinase [Psychromonas sp. RZ22]TEW54582.1 HAMP domain-containing histidine kinase [Psychromonas sp. RZ22]
MKIKPSLKLYFLAMTIMAGIATISIMSVVSFKYFLDGIDFYMLNTMRSQAYKQPVNDAEPVMINDFVIANRWQDLPDPIKNHLNQTDLVEGELLKHIVGNPPFSRPEAGYFALKLNYDGQTRYVSSMFSKAEERIPIENNPSQFLYLIFIALVVMLLFSLVPYFILRKVTTPVEKLMSWTKKLNRKELVQTTPDFHYSEFNKLAAIVQSSLVSVQESLDREQQFLGYASHELRTPIAVTRTNTELLRKMISKNISPEKQLQVLDRIERASVTMTDLTETLLWLNRQSDKSIPSKSIEIGLLTNQLLEELAYLLTGKDVEVSIITDQSSHILPQALCRIVITNLIRNALQHTAEGSVTIKQNKTNLIISNKNVKGENNQDELGFGLGLELTKRLVQHYGWKYKNIATDNGHYVEIDFNIDSESS